MNAGDSSKLAFARLKLFSRLLAGDGKILGLGIWEAWSNPGFPWVGFSFLRSAMTTGSTLKELFDVSPYQQFTEMKTEPDTPISLQ